ncbi:MAG TPA: BamA/TamA family outer membrane protein [Vicinamibacterales bacterium]|nr:BamA/TamA family outer membrane protein [Vicinamibacterales bacterium]
MKRAVLICAVLVLGARGVAAAQQTEETPPPEQQAASRVELIEQQQAAKAQALTPAELGKAERYVTDVAEILLSGQLHWHPFWQSAYSGGGFTMGAGYMRYISPFNTIDVRGSITPSGYKRLEAQLLAPGLFKDRGTLSVLGGWREATQVGFYGFGMDTSVDNRANYSFQQPYLSGLLEVFPARNAFLVRGGIELTQWKQQPGSGDAPSVEQVYTPSTLPGLGTDPVYAHTLATIGVDSRPARGYARRGGFYGVTVHDFSDPDHAQGFNQIDYEAIQHFPILRESWVISLHGLAQTTFDKGGQQIPFFMMPSIGGGSDLRAYSSWRLRDRNSLVLQAEVRVIANRFLDMALFMDAGKVAARRTDLDLNGLMHDVGLGFRLHGRIATPLRIEFTHGREGFGLVLAASEVF